MDSKHSSFNFHNLNASIARLVFFRLLFFASAISIVSLICFLPSLDLASLFPKTYEDCVIDSPKQSLLQNASLAPGSYLFQSRAINTFWGSFDSINNCKRDFNLTFSVVTELMGKRFLNYGSRSLCIGEASPMAVSAMQTLGFTSVSGIHKSSFFSLKQKRIVCELEFQDCSFDFVFSKDVDKVSVPALLVLEVERILKPGGIGALLVDPTDPSSNSSDLVKSATPFSSLLKSSSAVHVGHVNELTLVVFKKRSENTRTSSFFYQHHHLQGECASLMFTKPLIELMEPLVEERPPPQEHEKRISYLPNFVDMSNRKRLVYIDIGVREKKKDNITNDWFLPSYYPIDHRDFSVYFVHYNTSILSHVKRPGITFVYHPGLSEKVAAKVGMERGEEEFDFIAWFKETVNHADFVVLKMHAGKVEMKFLKDMFESGDICFVNELFLGCSDSKEIRCMDVYKGLRGSGVFVHQWWETEVVDVR